MMMARYSTFGSQLMDITEHQIQPHTLLEFCKSLREISVISGLSIVPKLITASVLVSMQSHRHSQDFLWGKVHFSSQTVDDLFSLITLNTQVKTAKLTTPTLQLSLTEQKFPQNIHFLVCLGVHLQLTPIIYAPQFFSPPWGAPPGYAHVLPSPKIKVNVQVL